MKKRSILSAAIAVCVGFASVPLLPQVMEHALVASAAETAWEQYASLLEYRISDDGGLIIEESTRWTYPDPSQIMPSGDLVIPAEIQIEDKVYPVKHIGMRAFCELSKLTSITIPESVEDIEYGAFFGCDSLTAIHVSPDNAYLSDVDGVLFDKAQTKLLCYPGGKEGAYDIPSTVTCVGTGAFMRCEGLTAVTIPESVTTLEDYAFDYCYSLDSITIPASVTSIGGDMFLSTPWLEAMREENPLVIVNGIVVDGKACVGNVIIPDGVTSIAKMAFYEEVSGGMVLGRETLTSVTIPDSVTSIGDYAFYGCKTLTSITIPNSVTSIGDWTFFGCTGLTSITIPSGVTSIGDSMFRNCTGLTSIIIPDGVMSIGDSAFFLCDGLTAMTIPESVTHIGWAAFGWCKKLASVTILNPACEVCDDSKTISNGYDNNYNDCFDGVIYGQEGSTAQTYAEKYGYQFEPIGDAPVKGDVNADGICSVADAVALQKYLLTAQKALANWRAGDLDGDNVITAKDLTMLKRLLLS